MSKGVCLIFSKLISILSVHFWTLELDDIGQVVFNFTVRFDNWHGWKCILVVLFFEMRILGICTNAITIKTCDLIKMLIDRTKKWRSLSCIWLYALLFLSLLIIIFPVSRETAMLLNAGLLFIQMKFWFELWHNFDTVTPPYFVLLLEVIKLVIRTQNWWSLLCMWLYVHPIFFNNN